MDKVVEKLDNINQTLEKMLEAIQKPENKLIRILGVFGLVVGALGILNAIDIIINWLIGG